MDEIRDVSPADEPEKSPDGEYKSSPDTKKPVKNWFDKAKDIFKTDPEISQMEADKRKIGQEAIDKKAELDVAIAKKQSSIATQIREADPQYRAEQERIKAIIKARHSEARRLASLNEMITEYERRHPCKDEATISFYEAQLDNRGLMGSIFSSPEKG
jgi:hypothetical protein